MHFIVMSHCQRHCIGVIKLSLERVSFEVEVISCKITHNKYRLALNRCSFAFLTFFLQKQTLFIRNLLFLLGDISRYRDLIFLIDYWTIYWIIFFFFFNFVKRLRDSLKVSFQIYLINCSIYFLSAFFFFIIKLTRDVIYISSIFHSKQNYPSFR